MGFLLRALRLLSIVVWVGGIVFFAFVVAPVAFHNLQNAHKAGIVVRGCIETLHRMGIACGVAFLGATAALLRNNQGSRRTNLSAQIFLALLMLVTTLISQKKVLPAMEVDRAAAAGTVEELGPQDPHRIDFEKLHVLSERLEGAVLLFGIATVILIAREDPIAE
jgi:uncharacterized membrane protein